MPELDYANILAAGQSLIPDIAQQTLQQNQVRLQQEALQYKVAEQKRQIARQNAFQSDVQAAVASGNSRDIASLMIRYPEFADQIKPGFEAMSKDAREHNLTTLGSIYARGKSGDYKGAADIIEEHHNADAAAGHADEDSPQLIAALRSGDPQQQQQAMATVGMMIAASDPDKFADTYGKLFPNETPSAHQKEYDWRVQQFGKPAADTWLKTEDLTLVPVEAGGTVFNKADFVSGGGAAPASQGGGDQSAGARVPVSGAQIESAAFAAVPNLNVTSRQRSAAHNKAVGGVSNSYHLTDQARDFTPPRGMSMATLHSRLKAAMPGFDVINEGDHVHVEPGPGMGHSGPTQVRSKQQYDKLASGAEYIAPDGSRRRKP